MEDEQKACPNCNGTGRVTVPSYITGEITEKPCPRCRKPLTQSPDPNGGQCHHCKKEIKKVYYCGYCGRDFCKSHKNPKKHTCSYFGRQVSKKTKQIGIIAGIIILLIFSFVVAQPDLIENLKDKFINRQQPEKTTPPTTTMPPTSSSKPQKPTLDPLPPGYFVRYNLKKTEYKSKKFPMPIPEIYTGGIVGVYGKEKDDFHEMNKKVYVINFTTEKEAKQFTNMMFERYSRLDSDIIPKINEIGPLTVYSRYSNGPNQYLGCFFSLGKYVYYLRTDFTDVDERTYIADTFFAAPIPPQTTMNVSIDIQDMTLNETQTPTDKYTTENLIEPAEMPKITVQMPDIKGAINNFLKEYKEKQELKAYGDSKKSLEYVNAYRAHYGRRPLAWSDEIYQLAMFRAEDQYERNYFDHKTPEGKCVNHFAKQFNVSYSVAENLGKGYYTREEAVNGWMESRGHRYNLLYIQHTMGAIARYGDVYVFLGTGPSEYGWQCATGEEGLAFWEEVSKQPGEV